MTDILIIVDILVVDILLKTVKFTLTLYKQFRADEDSFCSILLPEVTGILGPIVAGES